MSAAPVYVDTAEADQLVAECIDVAARRYRLHPEDIAGGSRLYAIVWARQVAMWLACQSGMSLSAVGRALDRDHTTVLHACRKVERARAANADDRLQTDRMLAELEAVERAASVDMLPPPQIIAAMRLLAPHVSDPYRRRQVAAELVRRLTPLVAASAIAEVDRLMRTAAKVREALGGGQ